jgi:hypothetical protein
MRGRGIGPKLLEGIAQEMRKNRVRLIEAHVDAINAPSLRAFLKAGWQATQREAGDYYVCRSLCTDAETAPSAVGTTLHAAGPII